MNITTFVNLSSNLSAVSEANAEYKHTFVWRQT